MPASTHAVNSIAADRPTPLLPVLAFAFLNSIGSAVIYSGLFSLAKFQYGFDRWDNFLLALLYGLMYIPAAMLVGPILKRLPAGSRVLNHRGMLAGMMLVLGVLCWVPWLAWGPPMQIAIPFSPGDLNGFVRPPSKSYPPSWPIWLVCAVYSPISGMMWPIVESYVSGGRRGSELRRAIGRFNISWASALVLTLFAMARFVEHDALLILRILGVIQIVTAICLWWFQPLPGAHEHDPELPTTPTIETEVACPHCHYALRGSPTTGKCPECGNPAADAFHLPHPPVYARLLRVHQVLLPVAFLGISVLAPYLTIACARLGIAASWETPVIAVWMSARVAMFAMMERWHGWHGRWNSPIAGIVLVLVSLAAVVLTPVFMQGTGAMGIVTLCAGLLGFGVGIGMIYAATLYYTMEVGSAAVEASGLFETLIGIGYTLGPLCGLAGSMLVRYSGATEATGEWVTLAMVGTLAAAGLVAAWRRGKP